MLPQVAQKLAEASSIVSIATQRICDSLTSLAHLVGGDAGEMACDVGGCW